MVRFTSLSILALSPLVHARLDWLHARGTAQECPPCPAEGEPQGYTHTVTITEPAEPGKTVTVSDPEGSYQTVTVKDPSELYKTVTVTEHYETPQTKVVYVSQGETIYPPKETVTVTHQGQTVTVTKTENEEYTVTKQVNVYPGGPGYTDSNGYQPGPKTITLTRGHPVPSAGYPGDEGGVVTKIVDDNGEKGDYPGSVHTVTVVRDGELKTLTITNDNYNKVVKTITQQNGEEKTVTMAGNNENKDVKTITLEDGDKNKVIKTITVEDSNKHIVTKTIQDGDMYHTVIIKPEPTITTITDDNGGYITTVVEVPCTYTITAPAKYATAAMTGNDDSYKTITRTATYGGEPEVEVIVYDPETGKSNCEKDNGSPCHPGYENDKTGYGEHNGSHDGGDDETHYDSDEKAQYGENNKPHYPGGNGTHHGNDGKPHYPGDDKGQYGQPGYTKVVSNGNQTYTIAPVYTKVRTYDNGHVYTEAPSADDDSCDSVAMSTSIATVYNTLVVTVGAGSNDAPSATTTPSTEQPTSGRSFRAPKKPRSPLSMRW
ncbi:hypothetical protein FZEAL_6780 [Fusarium zealandicum]|uniref:Uncharacterized protein n=1 Tax=Fusarium zealandicum TaxID=1053134 RepID=A0A8H4UH52_9HYPO|nr:hypothetical protein FZEAL_6780 [Fusarium zealandicum]